MTGATYGTIIAIAGTTGGKPGVCEIKKASQEREAFAVVLESKEVSNGLPLALCRSLPDGGATIAGWNPQHQLRGQHAKGFSDVEHHVAGLVFFVEATPAFARKGVHLEEIVLSGYCEQASIAEAYHAKQVTQEMFA